MAMYTRGPSHRDMLVRETADRLRLEADIVGERWARLKEATVRVANHQDAFRRECALLGEEKAALAREREAFEEDVRAAWPAATLTAEEKLLRITLNVGGTRFESTAEVLTKDRFSVLAALCTDTPPVDPDADGAFFFDRDGALFQHILNFLRDDGVLPEDQDVLRGLYTESAFFRLGLMRREIEARFDRMMARAEQLAWSRSLGGGGGGVMMSTGMGTGMGGMNSIGYPGTYPQPTMQQIAAAGRTAFASTNNAGTALMAGASSTSANAVNAGTAAGAAAATSKAMATFGKSAAQRQPAASTLPDPYGFTSGSRLPATVGAATMYGLRDDFGL